MSNGRLITTMVTKWGDKDRPFRAELRVDGYPVLKSYHASMQEAFVWADEKKAAKLKELNQ